MTRSKYQIHFILNNLIVLLLIMNMLNGFMAQEFLELEETPTSVTGPELNDPSDLSAGLNLVPVTNLIAAAANAVPPAPVQFVRTAMNSGL